jgi:hypothetical protein
MTINQELLNEFFLYKDGDLYWKVDRGSNKVAGKKAGKKNNNGYLHTKINGKLYQNHRLIFMMCHGYLPEFVDHIDGNRSNNRIENLRPASNQQNTYNRKLNKNSTSGIKGVTWHKRDNCWMVQIQSDGKKKHLGYFHILELAELVAIEARDKYHKDFANHG